MNTMNPPAITKTAISLAERISRLKAMKNRFNEGLRNTLIMARDMGQELLEAKDQCTKEQTGWGAWLKKANLQERPAQQYMRVAKYWTKLVEHPKFNSGTGLAESLEILASIKHDPEPPGPITPSQFCERCQRVGPVKDCPECAALHDLSGERQAGDDSEQEAAAAAASKAAPRNGAELFKWREFEKEFRHVVKLNDDMAKIAPPALAKEANEHLSAYLKVSSRMYQAVTSQPVPE